MQLAEVETPMQTRIGENGPENTRTAQTALIAFCNGAVILPGDTDYDEARKVWNGRVDRQPAMIVRAVSESDAIACVNAAREYNLPLSVRGAGHHPAGFGTNDGGIVLDMSGMNGIMVDTGAQTAIVQAGVTAGAFFTAIEAQGFVVTVGSHPTVGLAGLTLGGGMGSLMGRYGLTADNLLEARVVTADGVARTVNAAEQPDLFWMLCGGGGNIGVVTSLTYRLHPAEPTLHGFLMHPIERAGDVLRFVREFTANPDLPDNLTILTAMLTGPGGQPVCAIMPCYTGSLSEGEEWLAPLRQFGPPLLDTIHPAPYSELLNFFAALDPAGGCYSYSSQGIPVLTDAIIDTVASFGQSVTSPETAIVLYHVHGAVSRVPKAATAFPARDIPYFLGIFAGWRPGDDAARHCDWQTRFRADLAPDQSTAQAIVEYPNLTDAAADCARVKTWYGANAARLSEIKARWDPTWLFRNTPTLRQGD